MLRRLTIRDFVIVDRLELDFLAGFGALTGETGAGKSILLDALGLALGGRADAGAVRVGRDKADIAAEFDLPADGSLSEWLAELDLPADEGTAILRRVVEAGGRSRAWINGVPVTQAQLREAGDRLADIHGQHAHHALLRGDAQRALVDAHAAAAHLASEVADRFRDWQRLSELRRAAEQDSVASERERDLLAWQIDELRNLAFDAGEWSEINQEHARLAHAAGLMEGADEALATLGEGEVAVTSLLRHICVRVDAMADIDPGLGDVRELLSGAAIQADEALHALRRYRDRLDLDPQRLAEIERRIEAVTDLARKYRVEPDGLPDLLDQWTRTLDELVAQADPVHLAEQEAQARAAYEQAATRLSLARRPAAERLSREVSEAMQALAMAGGQFAVALEPCAPSAHGVETVEFRVAANPSQPLRSLAKVASGGELSRIGLAIQVMTSRDSATPTLIFDEVDVGIGGGVAEIVGKLLHRLGLERQVLCVTHLPQVAACADWQWNIAKSNRGNEVVSAVTPLEAEGRIEEIARMLGGVNITDTTRRHAAEMLGLSAAL
ncbi:DNA repair protein RecN [Aromatoleum petrolei]|uniref:DNA repair protein RecN n=1 Tax=Aromatoleum petrolei TaxID=76116 RepID=A0ABX1ML53_9RHOO|nr:DNA repair protein RecN [Aromatoleum petrolei]NMF88688.1 DNA repair protein RecN [Aromatoleum petrolei]QTQ37891.1 DNA repair protein [Aromatoleum petrolei]